jgi:hypothetical protein
MSIEEEDNEEQCLECGCNYPECEERIIKEFLEDWDFECPLEKKVSIRKGNHAWTIERYKNEMKEKWEKRVKE